jgi:hypothetical protein
MITLGVLALSLMPQSLELSTFRSTFFRDAIFATAMCEGDIQGVGKEAGELRRLFDGAKHGVNKAIGSKKSLLNTVGRARVCRMYRLWIAQLRVRNADRVLRFGSLSTGA